jgi:cytidyltransferase-like protein
MHYKFHQVLVGGTFDHFHLGHQKLLMTAFELSENVTIGIATKVLFAGKAFAEFIEENQIRERSVSDFLSEKGLKKRAKIVPIHDIYGVSLDSDRYDAIFVTKDSQTNALKINEERERKGFKKLEIISVPFVLGNDGKIISSERIRGGKIDRDGKSYAKLFMQKEQFVLPITVREELRQPIGPIATDMQSVISSLGKHAMLIAVGDIVAASASKSGRQADINITDGKTRRQNLESGHAISFSKMTRRTTDNPAGTITREAAKTIAAAVNDYETSSAGQLIDVLGEEDLLAIPAILLAPLSAVVIYGQFDQGIVVVTVSEQNKKRVQDLFRKFQ